MAGLVLGLDGKKRAVKTNTSSNPPEITNFYVGLLQTLPANYDGLSLADLITGNEIVPETGWYTEGRQEIFFNDTPVGDYLGAWTPNTTTVTWTNGTVSDKDIAGVFVTNAQTGTSGLVLWVGPPDIGTLLIPSTKPAYINVGSLITKVD